MFKWYGKMDENEQKNNYKNQQLIKADMIKRRRRQRTNYHKNPKKYITVGQERERE